MSLRRYTKGVDGTIPVQALLYEDEELLASQDGIGIYDGTDKSAPHQSGIAYATTHRLFYVDAMHPDARSFEMDLSHVARTEYYAGLFTSSPKVTLYLHPIETPPSPVDGPSGGLAASEDPAFLSWTCDVCNYRNPPGLSPAASRICALCGVPRSATSSSTDGETTSSAAYQLSSSLPSSSGNFSRVTTSSSSSPRPASPPPQGPNDEIACPICTFLNHPALTMCEMCGTPLPKRVAPPRASQQIHAKSAPASRPTSPLPDKDGPDSRMIRLSFRKGGDKTFYAVLRRSLLGKGWELKSTKAAASSHARNKSAPGQTSGLSGINGILRNVETTAATSQTDMEDALKDFEALTVKWRDMVKLAQDLNERLTAAPSTSTTASALPSFTTPSGAAPTSANAEVLTTQAVEPEEATFIRSSLAQLGLQMANAPVTLDMIRDERRWIEELARELAGVLQGGGGKEKREGIMRQRGIVGLDEVWGGWNRARGVALIPPSTFLQVIPQLPQHTDPPIHMRTFTASGLSVVHTPPYTKAAFTARLVGLLSLAGPQTTVQVAREEALPIGLTQEMVNEVEDEGEICRDEGGSGLNVTAGLSGSGWASSGGGEVRLWVNIFQGYVWDGQKP
ncbi:EAP30/Vps36 family-domain-containing protein [Rhodofomes roseus]|uniref:Vacuolar protein-sorting-associated protein 36 n=1 Tax=Rhodofomes roseus TaxID=34475 RepID=A0ABQ8KIP3_9APHY|nr:EAP30/Vps36 family-domain-containing protein [Rhodofomes roseus]KAH9837869.1 EAP30/Vps36 family-domain-containing protein [Rhodofomes roseus]